MRRQMDTMKATLKATMSNGSNGLNGSNGSNDGQVMRGVRVGQCKRFLRAVLLAAVLCSAHVAFAHDFWIEPATFRPMSGARTSLTLHVGTDFKGESIIFHPEYFNRYIVAGPDGERKVEGELGDDPAGRAATAGPGIYAAIYDSKQFDIAFDDFSKFESYLKEEGLERQLALAKARGPGKVREMYSRCAKTLLAVSTDAGSAAARASRSSPAAMPSVPSFDRYFKCALELVAENNPYAMKPGGELRLRLLFREKPVEGVLVAAFNKSDPTKKLNARTDKEGRVTFALPRNGVWLTKAVHMVVPARLTRADWESFWASLTFEIP